jgi:hypothetical protein
MRRSSQRIAERERKSGVSKTTHCCSGACFVIAGRSLPLRKRYSFALAIACIECPFIPFGTILGVFTIVARSRESVKALFEAHTR